MKRVLRLKFDDLPDLVYDLPIRPRRYCDKCDAPGYYVRDRSGEVFFICHDGTRWCSAPPRNVRNS